MKKLFLSYRFTGEDLVELEVVLRRVVDILKDGVESIFSSLFLEDFFYSNDFTTKEIYEYCLKEQEKSDIIVVFIKSKDKSKGMEMELKKALELGQKIVLVIKENLEFENFRSKCHNLVEFKDFDDLYEKLEGIDF